MLRRIVPGQYLAIDPKGRAVMIGAIEKQKLVYILNRDAQVTYLYELKHKIPVYLLNFLLKNLKKKLKFFLLQLPVPSELL